MNSPDVLTHPKYVKYIDIGSKLHRNELHGHVNHEGT